MAAQKKSITSGSSQKNPIQQHPRRKYNIVRESVRQAMKPITGGFPDWVFIPVKANIKRIQKDLDTKNLMFAGGQIEDVPWTVMDVAYYMGLFPPPIEKQAPLASKIKNVPVFTKHCSQVMKPFPFQGQITEYNYEGNTAGLLAEYQRAEKFHKDVETHHPDGVNFVASEGNSFEVVFDVYNSLLRTLPPKPAYYKLLDILKTSKYASLNSKGVYGALLHFLIRGVDNSSLMRSSRWRTFYPRSTPFVAGHVNRFDRPGMEPIKITKAQYYEWHRQFLRGEFVKDRIMPYLIETYQHRTTMESELIRLRLGTTHDKTKYQGHLVWTYAWYWGVWQQLSDTDRYRLLNDYELHVGQETMFSMGKNFSEGMAASASLHVPKIMEEGAKRMADAFVPEVTEAIRNESEHLVSQLGDISSNASSTMDRVENLVNKLTQSVEGVASFFDSIKLFAEGYLDKIKSSINSFLGLNTDEIKLDNLLMALRDFILYMNVDSLPIKTILIVSIFNNLGLTSMAYQYFLTLSGYAVNTEMAIGAETSGMWSYLGGSMSSAVALISGVVASIVKGSCIGKDMFFGLVKKLAAPMREFHYIGGGCLGITRIFDFISKIYHAVTEWISTHILRRESESEVLAKKVVCWVIKVKYFSAEQGYTAIRLNSNMREKAKKLFPEYISLSAECRSKPEYKNLLIDVERHRREVKEIADYVSRLDALSTFCPTMFHVQFVGKPGVGKSTLTKTLAANLCQSVWPDDPQTSLYSYNPNLEFFDGYAGQKIFYVDDVFRMQDPKHLTTLIGLITNTPVILPMANLNDKGTQLTSDIMVSSTNTPWPVGKDVLCMDAVFRRRHMLVETVMDPDVYDESTGAFAMSKYLKKYKEEDLPKMPHLTFNLLRPVPKDESSYNVQTTSTDQFTEFARYAQKLEEANIKITTPGGANLSPQFYFSEHNAPPEPIALPCTGWTYEQLVHNIVVRYRAFRGMEQTFNPKRKFMQAETAVREIEMFLHQQEDVPGVSEYVLDTQSARFKLIEKWFTDAAQPYGTEDQLGEAINDAGRSTLAPELTNIDFDKVVEDLLNRSKETSRTNNEANVNLEAESRRREEILRRRNRAIRNQSGPVERALKQLKVQEGIREDGTAEKEKTFIILDSFPTVWKEHFPASSMRWWNRLTDSYCYEQFFKNYLVDAVASKNVKLKEWLPAIIRIKNETTRFMLGPNATYPDKEEFRELAGKKSDMSLYFLQHLEFIGTPQGDRWCFDATQFDKEGVFHGHPVSVNFNDIIYRIPFDVAFFMSFSTTFMHYMMEFDALTPTQQRLLVEDAKWRNQFTGFYTLEHIRETCTNIFAKTALYSLELLLSPIAYVMKHAPWIATVVVSIAAYVALLWVLRMIAGMIMGKSSETSKILHKGPASNIVYHGRLTTQSQESQFLQKTLSKNVRSLELVDNVGRNLTVQALHTGRYFIFPSHALRDMVGDILIRVSLPDSKDYLEYRVPREHFISVPNTDMCVVTHRELPQTRDISKYFMTDEEYNKSEFSGYFALLNRFEGDSNIEIHRYLRSVKKSSLALEDGRTASIERAMLVSGATMVGKSGSTVVYTTPQGRPIVVGIQVWMIGTAFNPEICIQAFTQESFARLRAMADAVAPDMVHRTQELDLPEAEHFDGVFTSRDLNNIIGQLPKDELLGCVGKSKIKPSIISCLMDRDGFGSTSTPAALSWSDPRLQHPDHPLKHSTGKYFRGTVRALDPGPKLKAIDALTTWIGSVLDTKNFSELSYEEIILGTREDGSNPMNLASSPGKPFVHERTSKGKRDYFHVSEEGELDYFDPDIRSQFGQFYSELKNRRLPLTISYDFPKDELRPVEKALGTKDSPPKTRTVTCMNMFHIMAWRKATLRFWNAMHRAANGTFPFCPGFNPEGPDWSRAYHYLNRHPNALDFDVKNWDGFATAELMYAVADAFCDAAQLSTEQRNVVVSIIFEVINSYIQSGRIVFQKSRGIVSGFPGTAEKNTGIHILLILYFWFCLVPKQYQTLASFMRHVSFLAYGDDVVITFSDEVKEFFNGETLQKEYTRLGYEVTDSQKTGNISLSKRLSETSFLKSSWELLRDQIYVRRMDQSVVINLLYWTRAKMDPVDQFCSNAVDAMRVMFGHGRKEYNNFARRLQGWLREVGVELPVYSYSELYDDHMSRYYSE